MLYRFVSAASLLTLAAAANFNVQVGPGVEYTPNTVTAAAGDTITFSFAGTHDVVQMDPANPCQPLAGGSSVPTQSGGSTFIVTVKDTKPLYFYCSVASHCAAGMVMAVNLPAGTTIDSVQASAQGKTSGEPPSSPQGGSYVTNGVTSVAGGSSATPAASTGGTTATGTTATGATAAGGSSTKSGFADATGIPAALAVVAGAFAAMI